MSEVSVLTEMALSTVSREVVVDELDRFYRDHSFGGKPGSAVPFVVSCLLSKRFAPFGSLTATAQAKLVREVIGRYGLSNYMSRESAARECLALLNALREKVKAVGENMNVQQVDLRITKLLDFQEFRNLSPEQVLALQDCEVSGVVGLMSQE